VAYFISGAETAAAMVAEFVSQELFLLVSFFPSISTSAMPFQGRLFQKGLFGPFKCKFNLPRYGEKEKMKF